MKSSITNIKLIIDGCLQGNALFQDKLFKLFYSFVRSICNRYSSSKEEASEMLNDTFYTVFKNLNKYDTQFPFEPWLNKVCVNTCLKYKRKYIKDQHKEVYVEASAESLSKAYIELPEVDALDYMKLLKHLPEACKTIINLYVIEEYKHQEIAEALNISVGTSKSNLHRAKQLLYKMLEKDNKGGLKLKSGYER